MSPPKATATGNLKKTPVPELLVYALDHALDGTLVLEEPSGAKSAILFQAGAPAKAKTASAVAYLGQVLVELGSISQNTYRETLAQMASERALFGQILLSRKQLANQALLDGLREQVIQKVSHLFKLPAETVFGFYSGTDFLTRWGGNPTRVKPLPLLWRGLRLFSDDAKVEAVVSRIGSRELKLYFEAPIGRFKLTPQERAVVDVLRARPTNLQSLLASGLGSAMLVKRVVYALAVARQLDFGVPGAEPVGLEEAPSSARMPVYDPAAPGGRASVISFNTNSIVPGHGPSKVPRASQEPGNSTAPRQSSTSAASGRPSAGPLAPDLEELKQKLKARASAEGQSYYEVLGVEQAADVASIQAAFFQAAKVWHPDRLPPELAPYRDLSTKVFARMSEAHQILTDANRRAEYDALLQEGAGSAEEQEKVAEIVKAAAAFQRAEVLLKKKDYRAAEDEALAAMKGDPEQADYKAMYAWVCAHKPREQYNDLIVMLGQALEMEPNNQRALWYRGQLHKRVGHHNKATRDFKTLLEINPKHLDAQREVRLHEMRRSQPKEEKGILGKWFKR